jgi:hypothetical protein
MGKEPVSRKAWWSQVFLLDDNDRRFAVYGGLFVLLGTSATFSLIQFESYGVGNVAIAVSLFFSLIFAWVFVYEHGQNRGFPIPSNVFSILWALGIGLSLWVFGFRKIPHTGGFAGYPFFPLDTIDSSSLVGKDTLFHATLMNSIINFGYPSTGLSDAPIYVYHTLSHYLESAISIASGISPLESLGIFFGLKIVVLLAGMLFFLYRTTKNHSFVAFLLTVALVIPVLTSRWVIAWSLSLWLPTFIFLTTALFTYKAMGSLKPIGNDTFVKLGIIGVLLSLGKISSGLFYMLVVGVHMLFNSARDRRVYFLGVTWFVFLVVYGLALASDRSGSILGAVGMFDRIVSTAKMVLLLGAMPRSVMNIYVLLVFLALAFFIFRRRSTRNLLISLFVGFSATCAMQFLQLHPRDIHYFQLGLFFIVFVFAVIDFFQIFRWEKGAGRLNLKQIFRNSSVLLVLLAVIASLSFSRVTIRIPDSISDVFLIQENVPLVEPISEGPQLTRFQNELSMFMSANELSNRTSLLFVPRELWTELSTSLPNTPAQPQWAHPLLVYAVTGVPLINGVVDRMTSYGFSAYSNSDIAIPQSQFIDSNPCRFGKTVIEVKSWAPAAFQEHCSPKTGKLGEN